MLVLGSGVLAANAASEASSAATRDFARFSAKLPEGWDGEERTGFRSGNDEECMLILGLKDPSGDNYKALVSVFVLPNEKNATSQSIAEDLRQFQAEATEPQQDGHFWSFSGEPRSQAFKSSALTRVHATSDMVLIAIIQDPENQGALAVFDSLKGLTPQTRDLLGR
ncbi:MAG: hypothetical protein BCS36_13945 [Desulfovibrio sp. MES5]|nr:MAG: hypothetical protein BCS36_13945 [Desulfovibrio sp. MES5]